MQSTTSRAPAHTKPEINARIAKELEMRLQYFASHTDEIDARMYELDKEWDIERTLEANAASASLLAVILGLTVNRKWFIMPGIIGGFLLQHALQGWCPPLPVFRRFGVRTQSEIEAERYALKAMRGDFSGSQPVLGVKPDVQADGLTHQGTH